jgi:hypothetical protein
MTGEPSRRRWLPVIAVGLVIGMAGCGVDQPPGPALPQRGEQTAVPPDFTIDLLVIGKDHQQRGAQRADPSLPSIYRSARYLVQPDRTLRAAIGPGVDWRGVPSAPIRLTPGQYASIYRTWAQIGPASADAQGAGDGGMASYLLRVRVNQQWYDQRTTPRADPAASRLVEQLGQLAGLNN